MSEVTDLVVIEKQNAMAIFTTKEQLDPIIEAIEKEARSLVPDVSTRKGRDAIASMAHKVARSKTYIDNAGKDLVAELKALPKQIDESRRIVRERLDALKDEVRRPLTEWEAGQERIKAEEAMNALHAEALVMNEEFDRQLAAQIEADHEMALLMNDKFDRDREEQRRLAEQAQRERDEKIQREAAEKATRDAEEKANRERQQHQDALSEISGIQQQVIIAQSGRLGVRQGGTIQCIKETLAETEAWPIDDRFGSLMGAAENAKQQSIAQIKQLLINAETIQKQQEENDRILREAEAKEKNRLAEEKRIADEQAKREADVKHRKTVGTNIVNALTNNTSLTREQAIEVLTALKDDLIPCAKIHY
ncbi:hypothetical protein B9Q26_07155 [Enterobacter hormaechei]|uniref:hypothetical protein n=1 Tax=Enterobacter hormaechei TaxID=158836 RepID=UPI000C1EE179|nr:hypothetical protein [Enterobacter hormaechei]PJD28433.1 hypothetical protein B9Q26_07155 [Enterobacter hormaechei]